MIKKDSLFFNWCRQQDMSAMGRYNDNLRLQELSYGQTEEALNEQKAKSTTA